MFPIPQFLQSNRVGIRSYPMVAAAQERNLLQSQPILWNLDVAADTSVGHPQSLWIQRSSSQSSIDALTIREGCELCESLGVDSTCRLS
jgi:hypothetical protein